MIDAKRFLENQKEPLVIEREQALSKLQAIDARLSFIDEMLANLSHDVALSTVTVPAKTAHQQGQVVKSKSSTWPVGVIKVITGEFAGQSQRHIVAALLERAPNHTLHIDGLMAEGKKAGCSFIRQSLQSMLSREKKMFESVEAGSGRWRLRDSASKAEPSAEASAEQNSYFENRSLNLPLQGEAEAHTEAPLHNLV